MADQYCDATCALCGRAFRARTRVLKRGWGRFCTKRCANVWRTMGPRNANYKGGRSYHAQRIAPERRDRVRERDGCQCVQCGRADYLMETVRGPKHFLQVHHVIPVGHGGPDEDWNLVTVCPRCHNRIEHGREQLKWIPPRPPDAVVPEGW